jgi:hypothetical protein
LDSNHCVCMLYMKVAGVTGWLASKLFRLLHDLGGRRGHCIYTESRQLTSLLSTFLKLGREVGSDPAGTLSLLTGIFSPARILYSLEKVLREGLDGVQGFSRFRANIYGEWLSVVEKPG